jgi:hypothetical protein
MIRWTKSGYVNYRRKVGREAILGISLVCNAKKAEDQLNSCHSYFPNIYNGVALAVC